MPSSQSIKSATIKRKILKKKVKPIDDANRYVKHALYSLDLIGMHFHLAFKLHWPNIVHVKYTASRCGLQHSINKADKRGTTNYMRFILHAGTVYHTCAYISLLLPFYISFLCNMVIKKLDYSLWCQWQIKAIHFRPMLIPTKLDHLNPKKKTIEKSVRLHSTFKLI